MGRRSLSSHTTEKLAENKQKKIIDEIDSMLLYNTMARKEIQEFLTKIEGTNPYWYLLSRLILKNVEEKVKNIQNGLQGIGNDERRNKYGF